MSKDFSQIRARQVDAAHSVVVDAAATNRLAPVRRGRPPLGPRLWLRPDRGAYGTFYHFVDGKPRSLGIAGDCEAQAKRAIDLQLMAAEADATGRIVPGEISVAVMFDFYKVKKNPKLPPNDKRQKDFMQRCRSLDRVLRGLPQGCVAEMIDEDLCETYWEWLVEQPARDREGGKTLSLGTACMDMYWAKAAVNFYSKRKKIAVPNGFVAPPRPDPRQHFLTRQQFARLLVAAHRGWVWDRAKGGWKTETVVDPETGCTVVRKVREPRFLRSKGRENFRHILRAIMVLFYTGTRSTKACELVWGAHSRYGSIDVMAGVIRRSGLHQKRTVRVGKGGRAVELREKPARASNLPASLTRFVGYWYRRDAAEGHTSVFRKRNGMAYTSPELLRVVKLLGVQAGIDGLIVHEFRHTTVTLCLLAGCSIDDTARFVGMSPAMAHSTYGHIGTEGTDLGARAMDVTGRMPIQSSRGDGPSNAPSPQWAMSFRRSGAGKS